MLCVLYTLSSHLRVAAAAAAVVRGIVLIHTSADKHPSPPPCIPTPLPLPRICDPPPFISFVSAPPFTHRIPPPYHHPVSYIDKKRLQ